MSEPNKPEARAFTVHLIGHAHLDLAYRWRWSETVYYAAVETFEGVLRQMEKVPGLTFAQSQLALYEAMEKVHPELFARIKARIKEGTWVAVGGMWTEPDMNMPCGESLVRQLLVGKRYARNKLGTDTTVAWVPDVFGHNANLPQILKKAGMKYYVAARCMPEGSPIFWWEGLDGSRVLAYRFPHHYSVAIGPDLPERIVEWGKETPVREALVLYGAGDHGGGPREEDLKGLAQLRESTEAPKFIFSTPEAYFRAIEESGVSFPVYKGELNFFARGCYTTQARVKRMNRLGEQLLLTAEKFAANALFIHRKAAFQRYEMVEAWKSLLRLQFHDNLPGTSIGSVYDDNEGDFAELQEKGSRILREALEVIGARLDTRGEGIPVVVYNPLSWSRSEPVEVTVTGRNVPDDPVVRDPSGKALPTQVLDRTRREDGRVELRVVFFAEGVPSLGYRLFRIEEGSPPASEHAVRVEGSVLENAFLKVEMDPKTGQIAWIFDKRMGREVLSAPAGLQVIPEHTLNTAWTMRRTDQVFLPTLLGPVEIIEQGPVRATVRVQSVWEESTFVQEISLGMGTPTVQWNMTTDWHESDTCLKVAFPLSTSADTATFKIPYGHIVRPTNGDEVPALKWIDVSGDTYGASLLNDCKYGFDVVRNEGSAGTVMRMSILRGAVDMDPRADDGEHELRFALYPHAGGWREAHTIRRANELNVPMIPMMERKHEGSATGWGVPPEEPLPPSYSFLEIHPNHVMVTAMKPMEEQITSDLVLRFYETAGKAVTAEVVCPVPLLEAYECNLMEKQIETDEVVVEGNRVRIPVGAYEIKTLGLRYAKRFAGALPGGWQGMEQDA